MRKILVSNDDGIYSPGLWALAEAASRFGEVVVSAPDAEQSGAGHGISTVSYTHLTLPTTPYV